VDRQNFVLAALAAAGVDVSFTPVQVQKLFFLIDREASHLVGGPHFSFEPYDYGPFDKSVYSEIDALSALDLAVVKNDERVRKYELSAGGYARGREILQGLPENTRQYLSAIALWVRSLSFQQLVSAIYKRHPDMKVNSVFQE
jgi:uncharacterized protein